MLLLIHASDGQTPEARELLVTNDPANEMICIVIESSTNVRLEIDVDGDGVVDDIQYTNWSALMG